MILVQNAPHEVRGIFRVPGIFEGSKWRQMLGVGGKFLEVYERVH